MTKKVQFITQGCSANQADSEVMAGLLQQDGYEVCDDAPLVVFNTCTVKGPTETSFESKLAELKAQGKQVIIAGCIPQSDKKHRALKGHNLIGTYEIDRIGEMAKQTQAGEELVLLGRKNRTRLELPKMRRDNAIEVVPISHGCLSSCTFCKTKHARGELYSYQPQEIVRHISTAVSNGAQEIWLTSQDNSAYGLDIGSNLAALLEEIVSIPKDFIVRVGMANPDHFKHFFSDFLRVMHHDKIFKFVHIPVQAGSDAVLADMKREYSADLFREQVAALRAELPQITIGTDIICGFPTESEDDFLQTLELVRDTRPDVINISRYWPRQGTPAAKLKQIPGSEIKDRTRRLTALFQQISEENNRNWIGWEGEVCFRERGKNNTLVGKNFAYKQVIIDDAGRVPGDRVRVRVVDAGTFDLRAIPLTQDQQSETIGAVA